MDQILALMERYLGDYPGFDKKGLTASMVNNYVKMGAMPPPRKKKYTRIHLAHLVIICLLKSVLPISAIRQMISSALAEQEEEVFYNAFCDCFEESTRDTARAYAPAQGENAASALCRAVLRAQAEQALALRLATEPAE